MSGKSKLSYMTDAEIERILSLSDEEALSEHLTAVAEDIFAAYCREVGGTSFEDKPIPPFSDLGERQKQGWRAAAVKAASYQIAHTKKIAEVVDLRSQLHGAEAHIALLKVTVSELSGAEERLAVAIDWIEGIPCLGRPCLLEDKQAILAALKKGDDK